MRKKSNKILSMFVHMNDNIYSSWNTLYIVFYFREGLINEFWKISVVCRAGARGLPWNGKEHSRVCRAVNTNKRYKSIQSKDSTRGKEVQICSTLYICSRSWTRSRGMRAAPMHHHLMQCLPLKALLAKLGLKMFRTDIYLVVFHLKVRLSWVTVDAVEARFRTQFVQLHSDPL